MRLTKNSIAWVKEIYHGTSDFFDVVVMMKDYRISSARFFACESCCELPKVVQEFMKENGCVLFSVDERFGSASYIYERG